eukprot:SAG11_NODE_990_length_6270_cov_38.630044_3_plen_139_part_00
MASGPSLQSSHWSLRCSSLLLAVFVVVVAVPVDWFCVPPQDTVCPIEMLAMMYEALYCGRDKRFKVSLLHIRKCESIVPNLWNPRLEFLCGILLNAGIYSNIFAGLKVLIDRSLVLGSVDRASLHDVSAQRSIHPTES